MRQTSCQDRPGSVQVELKFSADWRDYHLVSSTVQLVPLFRAGVSRDTSLCQELQTALWAPRALAFSVAPETFQGSFLYDQNPPAHTKTTILLVNLCVRLLIKPIKTSLLTPGLWENGKNPASRRVGGQGRGWVTALSSNTQSHRSCPFWLLG